MGIRGHPLIFIHCNRVHLYHKTQTPSHCSKRKRKKNAKCTKLKSAFRGNLN